MNEKPSNYIQAIVISKHGEKSIKAYGLGCEGISSSILSDKEREFLEKKVFPELKKDNMLLISYHMSGQDANVIYMSTRVNGHNIVYIIKREDFILAQRNLPSYIIQLNADVLKKSEVDLIEFVKNNIFEGRTIDCNKCDQICPPKYLLYLSEMSNKKESDSFKNFNFDKLDIREIGSTFLNE
jgi:hypothetical protein